MNTKRSCASPVAFRRAARGWFAWGACNRLARMMSAGLTQLHKQPAVTWFFMFLAPEPLSERGA